MEKIILLLVLIVFVVGCTVGDYKISVEKNEDSSEVKGVITDFEELSLGNYVGETITVKGTAISFPLFTTENVPSTTDFYGLRDKNGFDIKFLPRGERAIELGKQYTIKGTVILDEDLYGNPVHYIKEVKP